MAENLEIGIKPYPIEKIRRDFPILASKVHGKPLVYLDNAATTQKPELVINCLNDYYTGYNSNIHRGVHWLSQVATEKYEKARDGIKKFINAKRSEEIIFTSGATDSINLVASSFGRKFIGEGDEIVITHMEHHSNIVPWQLLCEEKSAKLKVVPIDDNGEVIFDEYKKLLNNRTKLVSFVHVSNSLGTVNPAKEMIEEAHKLGIPVLLDASQSIQHLKVDVRDLDCDFLAFSGHKIYGPTGIGVLYGKYELLDEMPPYKGGGDMISHVSFEKTTYNDLPYKFEAGTQNISGAIGLNEAINYVNSMGLKEISDHEHSLLEYATKALLTVKGLRIIGNARLKAGAISFVFDNIHPHDVGTLLDMNGVAIRTGHHCTEPVMKRYNVPATSRASFGLYNVKTEIDTLVESLNRVVQMFS